MTEALLQRALYCRVNPYIPLANAVLYGFESDFVNIKKGGIAHVYEIKLSRADFRRELTKEYNPSARYGRTAECSQFLQRGTGRIDAVMRGLGPPLFTVVVPDAVREEALETLTASIGVTVWLSRGEGLMPHLRSIRRPKRFHSKPIPEETMLRLFANAGHRTLRKIKH